jgi:hypothetical protein
MALGTGVDLHDQLKLSDIARQGIKSNVKTEFSSKEVEFIDQVSEFSEGRGWRGL